MTLNPIPHMRREPVGMLIIPLLFALTQGWCFGWASTPYDPRWELRHPRRAAWMAAAGPAANFALAAVALVLLRVGLEAGTFGAPAQVSLSRLVEGATPLLDGVGMALSVLLVLNVILGIFNLIPFPPLDGGTAIGILLPDALAVRLRTLLRSGGVALVGLLLAWWLFGRAIGPIVRTILRIVHPDVTYG